MKTTIELTSGNVVEVLKGAAKDPVSYTNLGADRMVEARIRKEPDSARLALLNLRYYLKTLETFNELIEYFGGDRVQL